MKLTTDGIGYKINQGRWLTKPIAHGIRPCDIISPLIARKFGEDAVKLMHPSIYNVIAWFKKVIGNCEINNWIEGGDIRHHGLSEHGNDTHKIGALMCGRAVILSKPDLVNMKPINDIKVKHDVLYGMGLRGYEHNSTRLYIVVGGGFDRIQQLEGVL